jgi:hypothetical protein
MTTKKVTPEMIGNLGRDAARADVLAERLAEAWADGYRAARGAA